MSIFSIILCHLHSAYPIFVFFGDYSIGVDLFFVISGFVVTRSFRRRYLKRMATSGGSISLSSRLELFSSFLYRRIRRLWPSLLLWSLVLLLPAYFLSGQDQFPTVNTLMNNLVSIYVDTQVL